MHLPSAFGRQALQRLAHTAGLELLRLAQRLEPRRDLLHLLTYRRHLVAQRLDLRPRLLVRAQHVCQATAEIIFLRQGLAQTCLELQLLLSEGPDLERFGLQRLLVLAQPQLELHASFLQRIAAAQPRGRLGREVDQPGLHGFLTPLQGRHPLL